MRVYIGYLFNLLVFGAVSSLFGQTPQLVLRHQHLSFGVTLGGSGLHVADLDRDGLNEIILGSKFTTVGGSGGRNNTWYVLKWIRDDYEIYYAAPVYPNEISSIQLADIRGDSSLEIVVAAGNTIYVYDSCTFREIARTVTAANEILDLHVVDVDSDGNLEFVFYQYWFSNSRGFFIYDVDTGSLEYASPNMNLFGIAVGNVDADEDQEIVVSVSPTVVLNGRTKAIEWTLSTHVSMPRIADVNQDGVNEIIGTNLGRIFVFDTVRRTVIYELLSGSTSVISLNVLDVNGDSALEIAYAVEIPAGVNLVQAQTGTPIGFIGQAARGVTRIVAGDVNHDGLTDLIWGAGAGDSGSDHLIVADPLSLQITWQSIDLLPPFYALAYGDLDYDGRTEILFGSFESDSGYRGGIWYVRQADTWERVYRHPPSGTPLTDVLWRIAVANVDNDPQMEIFYAEGFLQRLVCLDGQTFQEQFRTPDVSGTFTGLVIDDIDSDGTKEIIATTNTSVIVYDTLTGEEDWRLTYPTTNILGPFSLLRTGNVDSDPAVEIVCAGYDGGIVIVDGYTKNVQLQTFRRDITALELYDFDGDGVKEIFVGGKYGSLYGMNPYTGAVMIPIGNFGGPIDGLAVANVVGGDVPDFIFCVRNRVHFYYDQRETGVYVLWQSDVIGSGAGANDSLRVGDFDSDGRADLLLNSGRGVAMYTVAWPPFDAGDVNGDGCVNDTDLVAILCSFGVEGPNLREDLNADLRVDDLDLVIVLFNFGNGC